MDNETLITVDFVDSQADQGLCYLNKNTFSQYFSIYSYDMKAVTKEWSIAEKILMLAMGIKPCPPS